MPSIAAEFQNIVNSLVLYIRNEIDSGRGIYAVSEQAASAFLRPSPVHGDRKPKDRKKTEAAGVRAASAGLHAPAPAKHGCGTFRGSRDKPLVMFISDCPRMDEPDGAVPYSGKDRVLLSKMISAMNLSENEVLLAYMSGKHSGSNVKPDYEACMGWLDSLISSAAPSVIITFGDVAARHVFGVKTSVSSVHGMWHMRSGIPGVPTFDPTYLNRYPEAKRSAWGDLKAVMEKIGKAGA